MKSFCNGRHLHRTKAHTECILICCELNSNSVWKQFSLSVHTLVRAVVVSRFYLSISRLANNADKDCVQGNDFIHCGKTNGMKNCLNNANCWEQNKTARRKRNVKQTTHKPIFCSSRTGSHFAMDSFIGDIFAISSFCSFISEWEIFNAVAHCVTNDCLFFLRFRILWKIFVCCHLINCGRWAHVCVCVSEWVWCLC